MAINKVVMTGKNGDEVIMDVSEDTVTPETLLAGESAHDKTGKQIMGKVNLADFAKKAEVLALTGGTMTGPIILAHGDGQGILMSEDSNINVFGTSNTVLGFVSSNFVIGNGAYGVQIRGKNVDIQNVGNSGVILRGVSSNKDYTILSTTNGRVIFIQPDNAGTVNIGGPINGQTEADFSAKLIVNGDIKENGQKLHDKYALQADIPYWNE